MKILVTGVKGQLGYDVVNELEKRNHEAVGVDIEEMDITNKDSVNDVILNGNFDGVIHCAAWTAVDLAESNVEKCRLVNKVGTENIANACDECAAKLIYISTDYVFNGEGETAWNPDDKREPLNVYGLTKYEGELAVEKLKKHFIVRIAWVFGKNGKNFIKTVLNLAEKFDTLRFVNDQIGTPTYTFDLARLLVDMIESEKYGTYHATNEGGYISWYDFVLEILKQAKIEGKNVIPVSSDEFKTDAKRPSNSRMSKEKLTQNGFELLPDWRDAVKRYLKEIGVNENAN